MIRVHIATPRADGGHDVTLGCDCKHEHRIDIVVPKMPRNERDARQYGTALRVEHVRIMAAAGCRAAAEELEASR